MLAYAYTRCSHRNSAESGAGLAAQDTNIDRMYQEALDLYPDLHWAPDRFEHDASGRFCDRKVSAFSVPIGRRPAGAALLAKIKKGDILFVSAVDRMFRSIADMAKTLQHFDKLGVKLRFGNLPVDTSTPLGRMVLHQLVVFAEWESQLKSQRHKEAAAIRKAYQQKGKAVPPALLSPGDREKDTAIAKPRRNKTPQFDQGVLATIPRRVSHDAAVAHNAPGRVFVSIRCSHLDSVESGMGLEWQHRTCMARVERLMQENPNLTFGGEFRDEAVSAWKHRFEKRPQAGKLAAMLQPGDHVIFARLDRAFRSVRDMSDVLPRWQERGITVSFASDNIDSRTAWGRAAIGILAVFAQLEPEMTSSRTKEALRELRAQGRGLSSVWGFAWRKVGGEKELAPCRRKIALIRLAHWLHTRRGLSTMKTADRIEELMAKREGRRPLPASGIDPRCAEKWFGPGVDGKHLLSTRGVLPNGVKLHRLIIREFRRTDVNRALVRWPLLRDYCEQQRRETRRRREARRSENQVSASG